MTDFKHLNRKDQINILEDVLKRAEAVIASLEKTEGNFNEKIENFNANIDINDLTTKSTQIATFHETAKTKLDDAIDSNKKINSFYNELLDDDEENKKPSIESQILSKKTEIESLHQSLKNESEQLLNTIKSILPHATAAGLAASYRDAQKAYRPVDCFNFQFDRKSKLNSTVQVTRAIFQAVFHSRNFLWLGFVSTVTMLFVLYSGIHIPFVQFGVLAYDLTKNYSPYQLILLKFTSGLPLIWLAWYFQKSISSSNRFFEEYNHKQRVMELYEGFIREIKSLGLVEEERDLLIIMLDVVKYNPSQLLGKNETIFESVLSKFIELKNKQENVGVRNPGTQKDD